MFGREFFRDPDFLMSSFKEMNSKYKIKRSKSSILDIFKKIYIFFFGIPEIGLQIRSLYFRDVIEHKVKDFQKVLDAGNGIGIYSFYLARNFPSSEVEGWEIDKNKIKISQEMTEKMGINNCNFMFGDLTKEVRTEGKYDLIVNIDVLEHIKDYQKVLKIFYKLLRQRGYLYIHTPQPDQKRIFKVMEKWEHKDHVREGYEKEELIGELKNIGFKIVVVRETFGFFGKLAWELNHLTLKKGFILSGLIYPFLYLIALLDIQFKNKEGLGMAVLAKKI